MKFNFAGIILKILRIKLIKFVLLQLYEYLIFKHYKVNN